MRVRRTSLVAAAISLLGVPAAVSMVASGPANAETGHVICGVRDDGGPDGPVFTLYKIQFNDTLACSIAQQIAQQLAQQRDPNNTQLTPIDMDFCENVTPMVKTAMGDHRLFVEKPVKKGILKVDPKNANDLCPDMEVSLISRPGEPDRATGYEVRNELGVSNGNIRTETHLQTGTSVRFEAPTI